MTDRPTDRFLPYRLEPGLAPSPVHLASRHCECGVVWMVGVPLADVCPTSIQNLYNTFS